MSSVYTLRNPSTVSLSDGHGYTLGRRGLETTVETATSRTLSDGTSIKRLSASTALTVLSTSVSSEMLSGQLIKRIRPDSRTGSFHSRAIPSPRSSAHSSFSAALKARSSLQREATGPRDNPPPMPALPANPSNTSLPLPPKETSSDIPIAPQSVLAAGTLAQERRFRQSRPVLSENPAAGPADALELPPVPIEVDSLSVINEHVSDGGTAKPSSSPRSSLSRPTSCETHLDARDGAASRIAVEPESIPSGAPSIFSRDASPLSGTSATSLGYNFESNRGAEDLSESDDNMSDVTEHTDLSLIEAFEASPIPFQPILLSVLFSLRESVVARIRQKLHLLTHQSPGNPASSSPLGTPPNIRSRVTSSAPSGSSSGTPVAGQHSQSLTTRKRRAQKEHEDDGPARRGGDDGDKRKKPSTSSAMAELQERLVKKLACPFYKRFPANEGLSKSCRAPGWPTVHRVKCVILLRWHHNGRLTSHTQRAHLPQPHAQDLYLSKVLGTFR